MHSMKTPPPRTNIYPNLKEQSFWKRLKVAWRILVYGEFYPAPYDWYEKLYPLVSSIYSTFAEQGVDKAERDCDKGPHARKMRQAEATQWMRHYAGAGGKSVDIPDWQANFLVEWWVLRRKGIL